MKTIKLVIVVSNVLVSAYLFTHLAINAYGQTELEGSDITVEDGCI